MSRQKHPRMAWTDKSVGTFVAEITGLLTDFGAKSHAVLNTGGHPSAIAFVLETDAGDRVFRLEPDVEGMRRRLDQYNRSDFAAPETVAWAQVRHLIEFQLEVIETNSLSAAQVFGGFALTSSDRTVAEVIEEAPQGEFLPGERLLLPG